jgi:hypothetical protein
MVATEISFEDVVRVLGGTITEALQNIREMPQINKKEMDAMTLKDFTYLTQITKIHYGTMHLV